MDERLDEADDSLEALERAGRRRKVVGKIEAGMVGAVALVALLGVLAEIAYPGVGQHIRKVVSGQVDVFGNRVYEPEHDVSADTLANEVNLERVHTELLPRWLARLSHDAPGQGAVSEATKERYDKLLEALEGDSNLHAIASELGERLHAETVAEHTDRILYLMWAWNDYLRQQGQPYHVEANILRRQRGPMLYTKNYGLAVKMSFELGEDSYHAQLANRIDATNVVENYLCRATEADERVIWIADTSAREATNRIWPMLAAENDATLDPVAKAFAPAVRRELEAAMSAQSWDVLSHTAPARHKLLGAVEAVNERTCNKFRISFKPLVAYDLHRLDRLWDRAAPKDTGGCPDITVEELKTLAVSSKTLRARRETLRSAIEELAALVMRPRVVHEVRHKADDARHFARDFAMDCPGCDRRLGADERAELSGYLAGITSSGVPTVGLYRACWVATNSRTYHARATDPLVDPLTREADCKQGPAKGLVDKASALDNRLFERSDTLELVSKWPKTVRIEREL